MASAYIVFLKDKTTDPVKLDLYRATVGKSFEGREVQFHVAYGKQEVLEGPPAEGVVVLEFPDWDAAKDWYHSTDYQAAIQHRFSGAEYRVILVEGK